MRVVIVGSLNIDYIATVERLPAPGQTVPATQLVQRFGGKGANQAVAATRQGADVALIGCVGADDAGRAYCRRLRAEGIHVAGVSTSDRALTGTALIAVDQAAENIIVVAAGANGQLKPAAVRAQRERIAAADVLLLQLEIPMPSVIEAVRIANRAGVPVVLNPSPLPDDFPWGRCQLDTLIANQGEAEAIFGLQIDNLARSATLHGGASSQTPHSPGRKPASRLGGDAASRTLARWQRELARRHVGRLLITRGAQPTLCITSTPHRLSSIGYRLSPPRITSHASRLTYHATHLPPCLEVPTLPVNPIDTVGAGDAFAGTFVALRAEGADLLTAIRYANCAGALATLKPGAQEAIPTRAATEKALRHLPR